MVLMNHRDLDVTRVNFDDECQSRNLLFMVVVQLFYDFKRSLSQP